MKKKIVEIVFLFRLSFYSVQIKLEISMKCFVIVCMVQKIFFHDFHRLKDIKIPVLEPNLIFNCKQDSDFALLLFHRLKNLIKLKKIR